MRRSPSSTGRSGGATARSCSSGSNGSWRTTNTPLDALTGIAVATGPGSFNGIRVALTTAKSLALARDLPLYGAPTLDVAAWGYAYVQGPLWAILEAGRGQVYAARYPAPAVSAAGWGPLDGYAMLTPEELAERIQSEPGAMDGAFFCGEWREQTREALQALLGEGARFASPLRPRRACWLAELCARAIGPGIADIARVAGAAVPASPSDHDQQQARRRAAR